MYWAKEDVQPAESTTENEGDTLTVRQPLQSVISPNGFIAPTKPVTTGKASPATPQTPKTPAKLLTGEELERFKREVEGETVNKAALLGLLKKSYV